MGCSQPCEKIPALLDNPTENEMLLWHFATRACTDIDDPCRVTPNLSNPSECESALLAYLKNFSGCRLTNGCAGIPSFPPQLNCPLNLDKIIDFTERLRTPEGGEGGTGTGGVVVCGDTGLPLSISCLDPNDLGPGATDCSINCNAVLPEIRFKAAGGVAPYSWSLSGSPCIDTPGCAFGGVGGPGFGGPVADSLCDSRFVVTAPVKKTVAGKAYDFVGHSDFDCLPAGSSISVRFPIGCDDLPFGPPPQCFAFSSSINCYGSPAPITPLQILACAFNICFSGFPGFPIACTTVQCAPTPGTSACSHITTLGINAVKQLMGVFDVRTQAQIDGGCCPCDMCFQSLVVTVTDAIGTMVSRSVTVDP